MSDEERRQRLRQIREDAERTKDDPFPEGTVISRPNLARSKVLQVRLNPEEYQRVEREAARRQLPASTLVRSWILGHIREEPSVTELTSRVERLEKAVGLE